MMIVYKCMAEVCRKIIKRVSPNIMVNLAFNFFKYILWQKCAEEVINQSDTENDVIVVMVCDVVVTVLQYMIVVPVCSCCCIV